MADYLPDVIVKENTDQAACEISNLIQLCIETLALYDPQFAKSHYQVAYDNCRLLTSTCTELESLDLGAPLSASSIRKLAAPFKQSESGMVKLLGSCNGLVWVAQLHIAPYIWNFSTGLLDKLPDPGPEISCIQCSGFGYLKATDDYKVMVSTASFLEVEIFSLRACRWKRIQDPLLLRRCCIENADSALLNEALQWFKDGRRGLLLNEALHWLDDGCCNDAGIVTLDLAVEEFRTMPLPNVMSDEIRRIYMCVSGGCLCVFHCPMVDVIGIGQKDRPWDCIELWVMREYEVPDSWTKLFKVSNQPERICHLRPILVMETSTTCGNIEVGLEQSDPCVLFMYFALASLL